MKKRRIPIHKTFQEIRQLPLDVSMEQVRQWVEAEPQGRRLPNRWLTYFLARYFYSKSDN